jgi:hypothetical protein
LVLPLDDGIVHGEIEGGGKYCREVPTVDVHPHVYGGDVTGAIAYAEYVTEGLNAIQKFSLEGE